MATARHMTTQVQHHQPQRQPQGSRARSGFITVPKADNGNGMRSVSSFNNNEEHLTKTNRPDRRFLENRALPPPEEEINPSYTPAGRGEVFNGRHYDMNGRPDLRFRENRALTEEEIAQLQMEYLQAKAKLSH